MSPNQNKIKRTLSKFNLTQNELAEKLGVNQPAISKYCNGTREPPKSVMMLLSMIK